MKEKVWITDIYIKGFQSHEDTHIKLKNGFNAIVGPSNSGKSAIIRNLKFVLFNELGDFNFITNGLDRYSSTIVFSNGKKVTRERHGNENKYILKAPGKEPMELASFGRGPVEEVINFHGIKPINIAGEQEFISVQPQHDPAFFLKDTPAKKAALIGAIAKTDIVDIAISDMGLDISRKKTEVKEKKKALKEKKAFLEQFDSLPILENNLKKAEEIESKINSYEDILKKTLDSQTSLNFHLEKIQSAFDIIKKKDMIENMESKAELISATQEKAQALDTLVEKLLSDSAKLSRCVAIKKRIAKSNLEKAEKLISDSEEMASKYVKVSEIKESLEKLLSKTEHLKSIMKKSQEIKVMEDKFTELEKQNSKLTPIKEGVSGIEELSSRFIKGELYIKNKITELEEYKENLAAEIKEHPICPTCGADMTGRESEIIGN